jgi:hypothetical protein
MSGIIMVTGASGQLGRQVVQFPSELRIGPAPGAMTQRVSYLYRKLIHVFLLTL